MYNEPQDSFNSNPSLNELDESVKSVPFENVWIFVVIGALSGVIAAMLPPFFETFLPYLLGFMGVCWAIAVGLTVYYKEGLAKNVSETLKVTRMSRNAFIFGLAVMVIVAASVSATYLMVLGIPSVAAIALLLLATPVDD